MSFDKPTRNLLAKIVARCRDRLADDITGQLQSTYGLYPDGTVLDVARTEDARRAAEDLRALWEHFEAAEAGSAAARQAAAYPRLVREIGFTLLNRLAALRLCEERGLVVECVRRGMASDGFQLYDRVAGGALGNRYGTYRAFLQSLFDELALDLGLLFDRGTPQSHLFPGEAALTDVLAWLNDPELAARDVWQQDETIGWIYQYYNDPKERKVMRDASQAPRNSRELAVRNQFFTPRYVVEFLTDNTLGRTWYEMRRGDTRLAGQCRYLVRRPCEIFMDGGYVRRDAHPGIQCALQGDFSGLPHDPTWGDLQTLALMIDGYDLAPALGLGDCGEFANARMAAYQETGRWTGTSIELWMCLFFEQRRWHHFGYSPEGEALATIQALYAALREALTTERSTSDQEELLKQPVYIPPRSKKDPRDLRILDPACGSGHFLLYAFDLLTTIYKEAWDAPMMPPFSETGSRLADDYPNLEALRAATPGLILRHNLHGVDIDPRTVQIAALALWLRAQRAYQDLGLTPADRPRITRTNLVTSEPMPGDRELLDEFTRDLRPRVLGDLVRVVFEKMKLAGEAGSLLKIEEELAEAIAQARRQWAAGSKAEQMLLFPQDRRPKPEQPPLFDVSGITDAAFWETAEVRVLQALRDYATQAENGKGMRRRLFAEDAAQGFAFVDLYQQRFDVVLMNPPFGEVAKATKSYIITTYPLTKNDIYAAFVERGLLHLVENGLLGVITSRTGFFLSTFRGWREKILLVENHLVALADLGSDVLDDAMVEVASYVLKRIPDRDETACFFRLLLDSDKEKTLLSAISLNDLDRLFLVKPSSFTVISTSPFAYWLSEELRAAFKAFKPFEPTIGDVRCGLSTGDNPRFVRAIWEINIPDMSFNYYPSSGELFCNLLDPVVQAYQARKAGGERRWVPLVMAGASQPWFSPFTVVVNWKDDGKEIANYEGGTIRSPSYYFRPGFSWTRRAVRMIPYVIPCNAIPTASRYMAFPKSGFEAVAICAVASNMASAYMRMFGEWFTRPNFLVDNLKLFPWSPALKDLRSDFERLVQEEVGARRNLYRGREPFQEFTLPFSLRPSAHQHTAIFRYESLLGEELELKIANAYDFGESDLRILERDVLEAVRVRNKNQTKDGEAEESSGQRDFLLEQSPRTEWEFNLSYFTGCAVGRWDIRLTLDSTLVPELADPFDPIPVCPPGMLVAPNGLPVTPGNIASEAWLRARPDAITLPPEGSFGGPATIPDEEYPIPIAWDGILVDDPGFNGDNPHPSDIVHRVRQVLAVLWPENHDAIEAEACEILGVRELRDYFRRPGKFFADHLKRYSKSRRKAPIYWPLSTASGSYTLWLYYHRLNDQILFTAVNRYLTPKIERVEGHVARLEAGLTQATGRAASKLRDQLDAARAFLAELREFRAELLRVAGLPYKPDLNDGVIINAAPLHRLFRLRRWAQDTQKVWRKLEAGDYDWAHMAYTLWPERVREVCKQDRSIAIAHGLEELCEVPEKRSKKKGKG